MAKAEEHTKPEHRKVHGIVAMLDALAVRNATIDEAISFIRELRKMNEGTPRFLRELALKSGTVLQKIYSDEKFHTHTFGDTVILVWEIPDTDEKLMVLFMMAIVLSYMVIRGLQGNLRLRGALSIGELVYSDRNILGPAIADVASWYEIPEFIGVVATPECGQHLSYIENNKKGLSLESLIGLRLEKFFKRYDVPVKGDSFRRLWAVNWPRFIKALVDGIEEKEEALKWYFDCTRKFFIPMGTEKKYDNTEQFIIDMLSEEEP